MKKKYRIYKKDKIINGLIVFIIFITNTFFNLEYSKEFINTALTINSIIFGFTISSIQFFYGKNFLNELHEINDNKIEKYSQTAFHTFLGYYNIIFKLEIINIILLLLSYLFYNLILKNNNILIIISSVVLSILIIIIYLSYILFKIIINCIIKDVNRNLRVD